MIKRSRKLFDWYGKYGKISCFRNLRKIASFYELFRALLVGLEGEKYIHDVKDPVNYNMTIRNPKYVYW